MLCFSSDSVSATAFQAAFRFILYLYARRVEYIGEVLVTLHPNLNFMTGLKYSFYILAAVAVALLLHSCASMGRPSGGPQDVLPPVFVGSKPLPGAVNVDDRKIEIYFDELVVLKDQNDKVVVSPGQREMPVIRTSGRKVQVEIRDSLIPNTTYTIDFSDAIQDNNEGNPIDGFSFAFSTGEVLDTMQISGIVLDARTLEPQQKVLVGVHSNLDDTAFTHIPLERIARTNDRGQFILRNLKPGKYHLFALNDVDRDYKYAVTEDLAFYPGVVEPRVVRSAVLDTIYNVRHEIDTIMMVEKNRYYPNDLLLSMFNEGRKSQYLSKYERVRPDLLRLEFAAPADTLPEIELLDITPEQSRWYVAERSMRNDTVQYWITDTTVASCDTIRLRAAFLRTDTLQQLSPGVDTLAFVYKKITPKKKEKKKEKQDTDSVSVPKIEFINFKVESSGSQDINLPVRFVSDVPIDSINNAGVKLETMVDSVWTPIEGVALRRPNDYKIMQYILEYEWEPGADYKLTVDSASVFSIYGLHNKKIEHKFTVKKFEDYSVVNFVLSGVGENAIVELLNTSDATVAKVPVENGNALFEYINPGTYYARLFIDSNGNGEYDTGNYFENRQPEDVYYYNKKLVLKKNWDMTENWDVNALAIDMQKPLDIKKNKPTPKKWEKREEKKTDEEEDEYGDEFNNPFGGNQYQQNNNYNPYSPSRR